MNVTKIADCSVIRILEFAQKLSNYFIAFASM
ncbi:hypothetical protein B4U80_06530 [Leptotrombidium deliense]|uniref:Uncharacterized protein n=1 Tax=Leptotrombidium deliense TaxID=299467 RepID=A0A443SNG8_9ACAR|nr:hypothetical protein B4U80_06530 [Leptotrombidium deliense]